MGVEGGLEDPNDLSRFRGGRAAGLCSIKVEQQCASFFIVSSASSLNVPFLSACLDELGRAGFFSSGCVALLPALFLQPLCFLEISTRQRNETNLRKQVLESHSLWVVVPGVTRAVVDDMPQKGQHQEARNESESRLQRQAMKRGLQVSTSVAAFFQLHETLSQGLREGYNCLFSCTLVK